MTQSPHSSPASPKLSLAGASTLGVASMLGAGVFIVFAPAAAKAGSFLLLAIAIAGIVAGLNARSMRQLAAVVSRSGGAYSYGRIYISKSVGFTAGVAFVIGKIASVAAIALVVGNYTLPEYSVAVALGAIAIMTLINLLGINRTALGAFVLSLPTLLLLTAVIITGLLSASKEVPVATDFSASGILAAAALVFFAFAGYARVATLGEEVVSPLKNVPRAIAIALSVVLLIYLLVGLVLQKHLSSGLELTNSPVLDFSVLLLPLIPAEVVIAIAASASLGSLLSLLAGISRTMSAMAKDAELPAVFSLTTRKFNTPWVAESTIAVVASLLVLSGEVLWAIGISSCAVLVYYSIANWAAFKQLAMGFGGSRLLSLLGLASCLLLALLVPAQSLIVTSIALGVGLAIRFGLNRLRKGR